MKYRLVFVLLFSTLLGVGVTPTGAQDRGVGVGVSLGASNGTETFDRNPVGITAKVWLSDQRAVAGMTTFFIGGGESTSGASSANFSGPSYWTLQADYLFHSFQKGGDESLLGLYIGAGSQVTVLEDSNNQFSLRVPTGATYLGDTLPVELFLEVAPTLSVTSPSSLRFEGSAGIRYYF